MHRVIGLLMATSLLSKVAIAASTGIILDRHPERVIAMDIAESSREEVSDYAPVAGPWKIVHTIDGVRTWEASLPVRPRTLFFTRPPSGMRLEQTIDGQSQKVKHVGGIEGVKRSNTWGFSSDSVHVRREIASGAPQPGEYKIRYPKAQLREKGLNKKFSDIPLADFVFRSVQVGDTNRHGLHLPAPSRIVFSVTVPEHAALRFDASILPPESAKANVQSDGATLLVTIKQGDSTVTLSEIDISNKVMTQQIDLSEYGGQTIELGFQTDPGASAELDYVFIAEPTIYTAQTDAPQVVLVFIDTLRADAMSLYGYERETTPKLNAWAEDAAVFTQARSVAPWTLPSTRTMVSGTHPERWDKIERLQKRLANAGWATGMIAGNVYLSSNFQMADDWGTHRCVNWPHASVQVQRGLKFLEDHKDQPSFLLLHLMDMHLPYTEPLQYRSLFVDETPEEIDATGYFLRNEVMRMARRGGAAAKAYIRGRYDNNLRYIDDQLTAFLSKLNSEASVLIVSDHGEEFWEHGGFEHGHSLYDELLRIPMVLKGPGVQSGRFDTPTSLLDVAPTLAKMAGVETAGMVGEDLRGLASGVSTQHFEERPLTFGRPLYGLRRWGSLKDGVKYTTHEGAEELYDLNGDPGETSNIIALKDPTPHRQAIEESLDRPFVSVWRMVLNKSKAGRSVRVTLNQKMAAAWVGNDPTMQGKAQVTVEDGQTTARWPKQRGMVEVYVLPPSDLPEQVEIEVAVGKRSETFSISMNDRQSPKPGSSDTLLTANLSGRKLTINTTWAPIPSEIDGSIAGYDAEVAGDLESLGYIDKETEK